MMECLVQNAAGAHFRCQRRGPLAWAFPATQSLTAPILAVMLIYHPLESGYRSLFPM